MNKITRWFGCALASLTLFGSLALSSNLAWAEDALPTENTLKSQVEALQKTPDNDAKTEQLVDLQASLDLLKSIKAQQQMNANLQALLADADDEIHKNSDELQALKKQEGQNYAENYQKQNLADLQATLNKLTAQQQATQDEVSAANALASGQATVSERAQTALTENLKRNQELSKLLADEKNNSTQKQRYNLELKLIELKNGYNQNLLKNNDQLVLLYQSRYNLLNAQAQQQQQQLSQLQEVINQKNLQQSQSQVEQAQAQQKAGESNPLIKQQLDINTHLSQYLLQQTEKTNQLTQDDLRMRSVLDNLTQAQKTIDEQISALQGTLVLSRIIQQQKQRLPTDLNIQGLAKQIADLRVEVFDITQRRNELYDLDAVISKLEQDEDVSFSKEQKTQLESILTERRKISSDLIKSLNGQLNLAINVELVQQQITQISDQIQSKLEQQSFWVKSNNPINLDWLQNLPRSLLVQLDGIKKKLNFRTDYSELSPLLLAVSVLVLVGLIIRRFKANIKQHLTNINSKINRVNLDTQWNTPLALLFTGILCLSSTLWFLAGVVFVGFFFFRNPLEVWEWGISMAGYWWFFAFILEVFRPHGIAIRHFGFSANSAESFRSVIKRMALSAAFLLNTSIFSNVTDYGLTNDVIGELITIISLIFFIFIIAPLFNRALSSYASSAVQYKNKPFYMIVRLALQLVPVVLVVLVALGYYYTALNLIQHAISTYIVWCIWGILRHTTYRAITVAARRLAYRRLQEKRKQQQEEGGEVAQSSDEAVVITEQEEGLALNQVRSQLLRFADLLLWTLLLAMFYFVWSDLLTVANYLREVSLWQQVITTDAGTVTETITLFNLIVALVILMITYILVRNISGILEVAVFSRIKLSQGTPYTITTLLNYAIVAIGSAWAFATLGMSWSKLQWLFSALLVGLGFGLQEIFANFVSGLILLFERPIRIGDTVTINGVTGTVAKIRIRAITIIDADRKEVIVPNKSFVTGQVTNWALSNTVTRVVITIGVAYGSNLELVRQLLLQAASEQDNVLKDPEPRALFLSFGASTLDHELRVYVAQVSERVSTIDSLNRRIDQLFAQNNIDIAFNQLDVFIKNQDNGAVMPLLEPKTNP